MKQGGFTTVEILITLFVAALFLMSGYQLYSVVINQSADTREMSEASNLGYEILRKQNYAAVANTCSSPVVSPATLRSNSLPKPASATVSMCKPYTDSSLIRVVVTVKYGSDGEEVSHATYLGG